MEDKLALCSAAHIIGLLPLQVGDLLLERMRGLQEKHSIIGDVRGQGLMLEWRWSRTGPARSRLPQRLARCAAHHNTTHILTELEMITRGTDLRADFRVWHPRFGCTSWLGQCNTIQRHLWAGSQLSGSDSLMKTQYGS